ncbi:MAG: acyltransferase family protein [Jatrophihabitans sp.]
MRRTRLTGLDGLRALAALAVLVFHADATLLPGGFLGVDLFFVISGYLITRILLGELGQTGGLDLVRFYLRRASRLLPALLVLLVVVTLASTLIWRDETATLRASVLATLGYAGNWWLIGAHQSYFVATGRPPMLQHLWSLAIEEQFYLIWPLVLVLLSAGRHGWRRRIGRAPTSPYPDRWPLPRRFGTVATASVLLALASAATMAALAIHEQVPYATDSSRVYFGSDTHSMGLLLGAAFGALAERLEFQPRRTWRIRRWVTDLIGLAALLVLLALFWRTSEFAPGVYRGGLLAVSAVATVLVSTVARRGSRLGRLLDIRPLRWLGERSYACYLWHWPVIVVTRPGIDLPDERWLVLSVRIGLPLVLAAASYTLVERPARVLGQRRLERQRRAPPRPARRQLRPRLVGACGLATALVVLLAAPIGHGPAGAAGALAPVAAVTGVTEVTAGGSAGAPVPDGRAVPTEGLMPTGRAAPDGSAVPTRLPASPAAPASTAAAGPNIRASAPPSTGPPAITAVGDSVLLGARVALTAVDSRCEVHAVEGRQPYLSLQDVRAAHDAGRLAPVVAIHTGNNGLIRPADLTATLSALADRRRVLLLTDRVPADWQAPNNATITRLAKAFDNVVVLDWYALSRGNPSWFYPDGLHLRPVGAMNYARLITAAAG